MKRILYIAILSMMAMTIWAPAALAQQGGGLCAGAQAVTSLSGSASDGEVESEPFNISTDLFQVAVDNTSNAPEGDGSTFVQAVTDGLEIEVGSMSFEDGKDGVFNASNEGNGPFQINAGSTLQAYDITVYECPNGAAPTPDPEPTTTEPTTTEPTTTEPTTTEPTTPEPTTTEPTTPEPTTTEPTTTEPTTTEPTTTEPTTTEPTTTEPADPGDGGGMTELPDTGGPDLLLPVAGLLAGSGILLGLFVAIRRRA